MAIPIIDLHCDVLYQMYVRGDNFLTSPKLDVNLEKLRAGHVRAQAFAIIQICLKRGAKSSCHFKVLNN